MKFYFFNKKRGGTMNDQQRIEALERKLEVLTAKLVQFQGAHYADDLAVSAPGETSDSGLVEAARVN